MEIHELPTGESDEGNIAYLHGNPCLTVQGLMKTLAMAAETGIGPTTPVLIHVHGRTQPAASLRIDTMRDGSTVAIIVDLDATVDAIEASR